MHHKWETHALSFETALSVTPGFAFGRVLTPDIAVSVMAVAWQEAMEDEYEFSGIIVDVSLHPARAVTLYKNGSPPGGEIKVIIRGYMNRALMPSRSVDQSVTDEQKYKAAVVRVINSVIAEKKQYNRYAKVVFSYSHQNLTIAQDNTDNGNL